MLKDAATAIPNVWFTTEASYPMKEYSLRHHGHVALSC